MKLTKARKKKYSHIKWDYAEKTGCTFEKLYSFTSDHPILKGFYMGCALCDMQPNEKCTCILARLWGCDCEGEKSTYRKWNKASNSKTRKKYAKQMNQDIKRS